MPLRRPVPLTRVLAAPALLLALVLWTGPAAGADDYARVQQLQAAGQSAEALAAADRYIAAHPRDPQMRFIKANVLSRSGQTAEARQMLLQLTREYPELPEPWNNLAVLYAADGELAQAREALQNALRVQPEYATALANLGDVLAREALQAFERARQAKADDPRLPAKIDALQMLWGAAAKPVPKPSP